MGAPEKMATNASSCIDDSSRYTARHSARVGHWDVLWVHAIVRPENVAITRIGLDYEGEQDRRLHQCNAARSDAAVLAGNLPVGIQDGYVGDASPDSRTPRVPARRAD